VAPKAKKAILTVSKTRKAPIKAKACVKSMVKAILVVLIEEVVVLGVVVARRNSHVINLLACYK
jgi:hypothetical protein